MPIYDAIKNLNKQFEFEPKIENSASLGVFKRFVVVGMGGSNLATGLLKSWKPEMDIVIHRDYGLPVLSKEGWKDRLVILSSYSGNTEEVLDAYDVAGQEGLPRAAITVGGKLLGGAKKEGIPYIQIPDTGIQPRSAVGFSFLSLLKMIREDEAFLEVKKMSVVLKPDIYEEKGRNLAQKIKNHAPVIYASCRNEAIAQNWRVRFHETGKIPAFYNVFPELNHNEMTGFDVVDSTRFLSGRLYFLFIRDADDHPRVQKRISVTEKLFRDRGLSVEVIELEGENRLDKIFSSISLADWVAYYTSQLYGTEAEQVPMVEEFKRLIV